MDPVVVITIIVGLMTLFLLIGAPIKPFRFLGQTVVKIIVGALMLFLLNTLGHNFGIQIPINAVTTGVAGLLGLPGIAALIIIKYTIIP